MICQWRADQLFETVITEFNNCGKKTIEMWWRENSRNVVAVVVEEGNNKKRGGGGAKQ